MKKIAFQGRRGAYSESAAYHLFGNDIEVIPMDTFEQIFQGIETGAVDGGAIPIENSTAGSIYDNYDLLYKWRHPIVGEVKLQISHSLCALPGTKLEDIKEVLSHPQGLAQCSRFFGRNPNIKSTAFYDTAGSAEEVAKRGDKTVGAIASAYAGKFYGLDILAEGIENLPGVNFTRFYAIQKMANPLPETGKIKTTLLFMLSDSGRSGALHAALGCFAKRNLNLTRIESRPHPDRPWEYIFHLSFEGNPKDEAVVEALQELQSYCDFVYRLGSFREGTTEKLSY
ncbi:prephenate dehydratase [Fibrobacter sp.]|uniref:prephenate dehydratase n=1 Tax=Fibrobacter sp. TaxID=35828 RepID=UPI001B28497A|nr:prephenate dehydratase [Fibrobacter sp.]MBO7061572.1 prephenate dehydratase [Fibrobacter sp.]MBO7106460.1 prephenate dehydratase [Fibrobacter sp.]MBR3669919.1 prephenate dehydratase [Fibrobacter sp.]